MKFSAVIVAMAAGSASAFTISPKAPAQTSLKVSSYLSNLDQPAAPASYYAVPSYDESPPNTGAYMDSLSSPVTQSMDVPMPMSETPPPA